VDLGIYPWLVAIKTKLSSDEAAGQGVRSRIFEVLAYLQHWLALSQILC
jgi:hypothetical protein